MLLEMRRRVVPTNEVPIIRDAETLFGKEVVIFDNGNSDIEMNVSQFYYFENHFPDCNNKVLFIKKHAFGE